MGKVRRGSSAILIVAVMGAAAGYGFGLLLRQLQSIGEHEAARERARGAVAFPPARVITFTPALTEIICSIGAGSTLVGRSSFAEFPPEVQRVASVGGLTDPNLELVRALRPDVVFSQGDIPDLRVVCERMDSRLVTLTIENLDELYAAIMDIGRALGREASARVVRHRIALDLAMIEESASREPRVRVFICVGRQLGSASRLWTVGPGSFIHEVVGLAGGESIFQDLTHRYLEVSAEEVVRRAPDVVLDFVSYVDAPALSPRGLEDWRTLFGSSSPTIRVIAGDHVLYPGPRVTTMASQVFEALHLP